MSEANGAAVPQKSSNGKLILAAMLLLPIVVILASTLLFKAAETGSVSLGTVNRGMLIDPPVNIEEVNPVLSNGEPLKFNLPESKWVFLSVGGADCLGDCETMVYLTRQTHTALGKKTPRVERIYLSSEGPLSEKLAAHIAAEHERLRTGTVDAAAFENLMSQVEGDALSPRRFYLVDPRGWIMMRYDAESMDDDSINALGKDVLKDMKRLLK